MISSMTISGRVVFPMLAVCSAQPLFSKAALDTIPNQDLEFQAHPSILYKEKFYAKYNNRS